MKLARYRIGPRRAITLLALCATIVVAVGAAETNPPTLNCDGGAWPIRRQWNQDEVQRFGAWIHHIHAVKSSGMREQRLAKIERVLSDPAINLLLTPEFAGAGCNPQPDAAVFRVMNANLDCAKLTVALSAYYAYKRALPWTFSVVRAADGGGVRIADYTSPETIATCLEYDSPGAFFRDAAARVCTGNFRVEPDRPNSDRSDTVPVAITREALVPGCMYYLDGHVLFLADISDAGEPRFLDATTSETRNIYAYNGFNVVSGVAPKHSNARGHEFAGCYRGFRAFRWPVAELDSAGRITAIRRRTDDEMKAFGYSTEQYEVLERLAEKQPVVERGVPVTAFHQFIRLRLRSTERCAPLADLIVFAKDMLDEVTMREQRVQQAWNDVLKNGPVAFPESDPGANVFTAGGRWGALSSALDDAACRARYVALTEALDNAIASFDARPDTVDLTGLNEHAIWTHADFAEALLREKDRVLGAATFDYLNAARHNVRLSLLDVERRLYALSFDPNHPPELRWGDTSKAANAHPRPTPLSNGGAMPMDEAYKRQAYYRALSHWEPEPSCLKDMFTSGFPIRDTLDAHLRQQWFDTPSPPLVPHMGKAAWLKAEAR